MKKYFLIQCLLILCLGPLPADILAHTDVTPEQAKEMIDTNPELLIVDVREESELCGEGGHIPGAVNYPWNSGVLEARYEELPADGDILVVCHGSSR